MSASESHDSGEWLGFGLEAALQVVIGLGVVFLGVWIWPSEMLHVPIRSIPLHDWVMTGAGALVAGLGLTTLYFTAVGVIATLRSGPRRA